MLDIVRDLGFGSGCAVAFTITAIPTPAENILMGGFWASISQTTTGKGNAAKRLPIDQARMQMLQHTWLRQQLAIFHSWVAKNVQRGLLRRIGCAANAALDSGRTVAIFKSSQNGANSPRFDRRKGLLTSGVGRAP